ncbi:hypothetical protein GCM10025795_02370 [Verticiella sediminum]
MDWDNSVFDRAFDAVGIRVPVRRLVGNTPGPEFRARFDRPQELVLDGLVHTTDYAIECTSADVQPPLADADVLQIEVRRGVFERYRVNQEPLVQGDGHWTRATLERLP